MLQWDDIVEKEESITHSLEGERCLIWDARKVSIAGPEPFKVNKMATFEGMNGLRDRSRGREASQQANRDVYAELSWLIIITDFQDGLDVCQEEGNVSESA